MRFQPLPDAPGLPRDAPFLAVPGFGGRLAVAPDHSVYRLDGRPELPPPWNSTRWVRLKAFDVGGLSCVRLPGGLVRSAALLWRAASAPDPAAWAPRVLRRQTRARARPDPLPAPDAPQIPAADAPEPPQAGELVPPPPPAAGPPPDARDVPGFEGYRIAPDRSVWSIAGKREWAVLPPFRRARGGPAVRLQRDRRTFIRSVAALHRAAFPPPPPPEPLSLAGLWADAARGERHGRAKLTAARVAELRRVRAEGGDYLALGRLFGVAPSTAHAAATGRTWRRPGADD